MTYRDMLLIVLLVPIVVTSYGQNPIDPKIQQFQEAWFKKTQELSELGAKILLKSSS